MKCQNCGRELKNGARFCIACGAEHNSNGQLVGGNQEKVDYNKTIMINNMQPSGGGGGGKIDYNKTMMAGSTDFKPYQGEQNQQNYQQQPQQQYNYSNAGYNQNANNYSNAPQKKKLSPIMIICPIIIVAALAYMFLGQGKKDVPKETVAPTESIVETQAPVATVPEVVEPTQPLIEGGYWSADADYFYIDGEMQKNMWVGDYYVGEDGKKVVSQWIDNKYYVDATGKKARNEWIQFDFVGGNGQKKIGFYYVGANGLKVMDKTVDGRYINEEGCYWPSSTDSIQTGDKGTDVKSGKGDEKEETKESVKESTEKKTLNDETTKAVETTKAQETTKATTAPQTTQAAIVQQTIAPAETSVTTVANTGNGITYQLTTTTFPADKVTKFVGIAANDASKANLSARLNEWNNNRAHNGIEPGETMLNDTMTVTYDLNVERNDNKIFSLYETKTRLNGSKVDDKVKAGHTWNASTGEELSLKSIFKDGKYATFARDVLKKVKSNSNSIDTDLYNEEIKDIDPADAEDFLDNYCNEYECWYMGKTGITIIFNRNQIETKSVNGLSFTFTYANTGDNINSLLLNDYRID